jgi:hypothetical protein
MFLPGLSSLELCWGRLEGGGSERNGTLGSHVTPSGPLYRLSEDMVSGIYIRRSIERNFEVYLGV